MKEEARVVLETGHWYEPLLVLVFTWTQAAQVSAWTWSQINQSRLQCWKKLITITTNSYVTINSCTHLSTGFGSLLVVHCKRWLFLKCLITFQALQIRSADLGDILIKRHGSYNRNRRGCRDNRGWVSFPWTPHYGVSKVSWRGRSTGGYWWSKDHLVSWNWLQDEVRTLHDNPFVFVAPSMW